MPIQSSGAVKFSEIQSEFGGVNPISASEYYRSGLYVTSNNTGVPTSGAISISQFYGTSKSAAGAVVNPLTPSTGGSGFGVTSGYVDLSVLRNGTVTVAGTVDGVVSTINSGSWYSPSSTTIGDSYWVRFTRTANSGSGSATATTGWLQLNTTRTVSVAVSQGINGEFRTHSATYTIEVASDSGGATIVSTRTGIVIEATATGTL